jgi:foldase protein PrsA
MAGSLPIKEYEFAYFINMMHQYSGWEGDEHIRDTALQETGYFRTLVAKADELGVALSDEDNQTIESMINEMIPYYAMMSGVGEDEYVQANFGVSLDEYTMLVSEMMLCDKLTSDLLEKAEASEEAAKARYELQPDHYNNVTVRHVLFLYEGADPEAARTKEESLSLAEDTLKRVQNGEDIGELAAELTDDTASAETGGEYSFTMEDPYVDEFKNWAFESNVGDTGIVETAYGYHVMQLDAKRTTFEELKDQALMEVKQDAVMELFNEWRSDPKYEIRVTNQERYESYN